VDCRGPNNAANAHLVTDGDVNTLFVHKMASLGTLERESKVKPTIEAFKMRPKRGEAFEAFEAFRSSSDCVDLICSLWNSAAGWAQCIGQKKRLTQVEAA